jgi:hypothetical protein
MQTVVGGIVKAFQFDYKRGDSIVDGTFWFHLGDNNDIVPHDATFIILESSQEETCYNVVEKTSQLDHEAVLEVYFTAYCPKIGKWVLAYERFSANKSRTILIKSLVSSKMLKCYS